MTDWPEADLNSKRSYDVAIEAMRERLEKFRCERIGPHQLFLGDCREILPLLGGFDALVCDPPYGIKEAAGKNKSRAVLATSRDYGHSVWDDEPAHDAISQAIKSSKWQIIFGGNYYDLPPTNCWLVWDKLNGDTDFADCELAWTNLPKAVRRIRFMWHGMVRAHGEPRGDHPTQKPVGVMKWCIGHLPENVRTVCDPFMGSGTTGVACVLSGHRFIGVEREAQYFEAAVRRISEAMRQPDLFIEQPKPKPIQETLDFDEAVA